MVVLVLVSLDISMYVANINIISSLYLNNHQIWNKWETYNVRFQLQRYPRWLFHYKEFQERNCLKYIKLMT